MSSRLQQIFWVALVVKLILSAILPLTNDEAYYWVWSQHLQLSYFDHPPIVAWLFWLGDHIGFAGSMMRWPGVLLGHATLGLWLIILRPIFTTQQRQYWLLLALLSPLVGGTNLVVTPDLPLLFFNALSLWLFFCWQRRPLWWMALLVGLSMGLGFSSKYVMVLFALSLLPLVVLSKELRRPFVKHFIWVLLGGIVGTAPVWIWNILNDFASIRFQLEHGLGRPEWKPRWTLDYVLGQIGLIFPLILFWALRVRGERWKVFHYLAWVPLLFFFLTTSRGYVEANWPIVAYPAIFVLAVAILPKSLRSIRLTLTIWSTLLIGFALIVFLEPEWSKPLKFREFRQYENLIPAVKGLQPLYTRSYQIAAKLNYEMKRPVYKLKGMNRVDFYDYLEASVPTDKQYYVIVEKWDVLPMDLQKQGHRITSRQWIDEKHQIWTVQAP